MNAEVRRESMLLVPAPEGVCPACKVAHDPRLPHNAESMHYLYRFYGLRGRWPTWADATAHCTAEVRDQWRELLIEAGGEWTEPEEGEPIADPPAESLREVVEIPVLVEVVDLRSPGEGGQS